jgi:hypothetical protein
VIKITALIITLLKIVITFFIQNTILNCEILFHLWNKELYQGLGEGQAAFGQLERGYISAAPFCGAVCLTANNSVTPTSLHLLHKSNQFTLSGISMWRVSNRWLSMNEGGLMCSSSWDSIWVPFVYLKLVVYFDSPQSQDFKFDRYPEVTGLMYTDPCWRSAGTPPSTDPRVTFWTDRAWRIRVSPLVEEPVDCKLKTQRTNNTNSTVKLNPMQLKN